MRKTRLFAASLLCGTALLTASGQTPDDAPNFAKDPLFREFSAAFDEIAPVPVMPELTGEGQIGAALAPPASPQIAQIDAEIARLVAAALDVEREKRVVGKREKVFGDDSRFDLREPEPIEVPNDLALALDAPFWFEVVDAAGAKWYSKAGDFELVGGKLALVRQNAAGERAVFAASLDFPNGEAVDLAERRGAARLSVGVDGSVRGATADGTPTGDALGTFRLVVFDNPARLSSRDGVFFAPTAESGPGRAAKIPGDSLVGVKSGRLSLSNGRPEEIWARVEALLRAKRALSEI